jgi:hypothetical protein
MKSENKKADASGQKDRERDHSHPQLLVLKIQVDCAMLIVSVVIATLNDCRVHFV